MKKIVKGSIIAASLLTGFSLTTALFAYGSNIVNHKDVNLDTEMAQSIEHSKTEYDVNASGQTYGSCVYAASIEDYPDLIAVLGDNGKLGYAYKEDFIGEPPSSPEEAGKYMESVNNSTYVPRSFNVYESDGKTVIDVMTETLE